MMANHLKQEDQRWFISQFVKMYKGEFVHFFFKIQSETFEGIGMCRYPQKKSLKLFTDSSIDISDFIFLINFVVYKDLCWSEKIGIPGFYRRTLCKYITLIDYYSLNHMRSEPFLKSIGYPLEKRRPVDKERKNVLFLQIETFDISLYE